MQTRWLFIAGLAALGLWLAWALQLPLARHANLIWRPETIGQWGDSFGALNALFAALAFLGVLRTLQLQRRQLDAQSSELRRQRAEQAVDRRRREAEAEDARRRQHLQNFDTAFFQLLGLLRELRAEVEYAGYFQAAGDPAKAAAEAFNQACIDITKSLTSTKSKLSRSDLGGLYEAMVHSYAEGRLGPYFRIVYTILQRIASDPLLPARDRARYSRILRSQMTSPEVALLALNGLTPAAKDLDRYITGFRMLKYLPDGPLRDELERHYPAKAFAPRPDHI